MDGYTCMGCAPSGYVITFEIYDRHLYNRFIERFYTREEAYKRHAELNKVEEGRYGIAQWFRESE